MTTDTSAEVVETLARRLRAQVQPGGGILCLGAEIKQLVLDAKTTLRVLVKERDAARSAADTWKGDCDTWAARCLKAEADRDALRSALDKALAEVEDAGPKALKYVEQELRAGLAAVPPPAEPGEP
jgi:hypothetical protein